MALADAAASLTGAVEGSDWTSVRFARLLESLAESGIQTRVSEAGLELAASCSKKGAEDVIMRTVALSETARQRVRDAMTPVIQGP